MIIITIVNECVSIDHKLPIKFKLTRVVISSYTLKSAA